jgi:hypothetical protein
MKKLIVLLCAMMLLVSASGILAEGTGIQAPVTVSEKTVLWEHTMQENDENGKDVEVTVKVTLEPKSPVTLQTFFGPEQAKDYYFAEISRKGEPSSIILSLTSAEMGAHANLNNATEEELKAYGEQMSMQFDENKAEVTTFKSEGGNTYIVAQDGVQAIVSTIYEDFKIDMYQARSDFSPLTEEDRAFAIEIFQSIWTE